MSIDSKEANASVSTPVVELRCRATRQRLSLSLALLSLAGSYASDKLRASGAGTPTPQTLQVPDAESPRAQPSQGREPTQTIEITGVLNHLHIFGANNTLGPENRYCSRGPA
jgi:hypothetical protein